MAYRDPTTPLEEQSIRTGWPLKKSSFPDRHARWSSYLTCFWGLGAPRRRVASVGWSAGVPRRGGKRGSSPLPPRERRFRPGRGGAARAPRPRPLSGPAPEGARFPRPACSPRAFLRVSASASQGPDNVAAATDKPVGQRPPGGNGACRTPPLAIRPRGERQGVRSPGWETHSPARAPGPLRPSPLPRTSPRALKYTVPEQALGSGTRRTGRATCARLARAPPPGRSRPAPGHSARGRAPAAFPAPPRPAPAPRPPSASQALPAASPGPPVCLSSLAGGGRGTGECHPAAGSEGTGEASGPPRRWRRGRPSFPLSRARDSLLRPFPFDPLVSREEEARLCLLLQD